jgi:hypothetical protein
VSNIIEGVFRNRLRERPFDFYVSSVLFLLGLYGIVDDGFPESALGDQYTWLLHLICLYFMAAAAVVMASLLCHRRKHPVLALMGEMYGWGFIAAAATATALSYLSVFFFGGAENWFSWLIWLVIWVGMAVASLFRSLDLYNFYRSLKG